jgi:CRISPR-associated protein Cas5t
MPPSTALGLVLNLAGIEMRGSLDQPTTLIRENIPCLQLAIGIPAKMLQTGAAVPETDSEICTLYQQLHSYPVNPNNPPAKKLAPYTKGAKYWIVPVRREFLVSLDMVLGVQADSELINQVKQGLRGELPNVRYGLPFAGDNNFFFDRIDILDVPPPTLWYIQMQPDDRTMRGSCRLTVGIDRSDNSKTTSYLYAPMESPLVEPPGQAWTWTPQGPGL